MKPDPGSDAYSTWHYYYPSPGSDLNFPTALSSGDLGELLWPDCAVGGGQGTGVYDVRHVIAHDGNEDARNLLVYWRYDEGVAGWTGPAIIDSTALLGYVLDACDNTEKLAIAYHSDWEVDGLSGMNNIVYRESQTAGLGWIDGTELGEGTKTIISTYDDPLGPEAWVHISVAYDHQSVLHIIWDEQRIAGASEDIAIRHWSDARGTVRPVALGYYANSGISTFNLNLAKMTLGIGDGSTTCQGGTATNEDYLYVLYTKFCGATAEEAADTSTRGYCNGELYLTVSNSGGYTWSRPQNLTSTKTPVAAPTRPTAISARRSIGRRSVATSPISTFSIFSISTPERCHRERVSGRSTARCICVFQAGPSMPPISARVASATATPTRTATG
ncbi:MAG: hypothetical protein IIA44_12800 [Acidobacteria bacterium]|nr:hypothetical protein [Acidobacteriota bacterium]